MADQDFAEYAVGWDAIVDSDADPTSDQGWAKVFTTPFADRTEAGKLTHMLRSLHRDNPAVRNVELYGRPLVPSWTLTDPGPEPAPEPIPEAAIVDDGINDAGGTEAGQLERVPDQQEQAPAEQA